MSTRHYDHPSTSRSGQNPSSGHDRSQNSNSSRPKAIYKDLPQSKLTQNIKVDAKGKLRQFGEWRLETSSSGKSYYYNTATEKSQWEKPSGWEQAEKKYLPSNVNQSSRRDSPGMKNANSNSVNASTSRSTKDGEPNPKRRRDELINGMSTKSSPDVQKKCVDNVDFESMANMLKKLTDSITTPDEEDPKRAMNGKDNDSDYRKSSSSSKQNERRSSRHSVDMEESPISNSSSERRRRNKQPHLKKHSAHQLFDSGSELLPPPPPPMIMTENNHAAEVAHSSNSYLSVDTQELNAQEVHFASALSANIENSRFLAIKRRNDRFAQLLQDPCYKQPQPFNQLHPKYFQQSVGAVLPSTVRDRDIDARQYLDESKEERDELLRTNRVNTNLDRHAAKVSRDVNLSAALLRIAELRTARHQSNVNSLRKQRETLHNMALTDSDTLRSPTPPNECGNSILPSSSLM